MLFNFTLDPVDEVHPWGEPPNLVLHWYGLSSGTYWLQAGQHQLLRYSDAALELLASQCPAETARPHVDYLVARVFEDIFEIAPRVLETIPDELVHLARRGMTWKHECRHWLDRQAEDDRDAWDHYLDAAGWLDDRTLHTAYLSAGANLWFWRQQDLITVEWDNRDEKFEEIPAWAERQGRFTLSVQEFSDELESFRHRFLAAMRSRAEEVCRSWSRPHVEIDRKQLIREQVLREAEQLGTAHPPVDWSAVLRAVNRIAGS